MPDIGHDMTEEMLSKLEKKVNGIYTQAAKEMSEKLEKQLEKYEKKLAVKQAQYDSGKISKQEFDTWKNNQAHMILNTRNMSDTLTQDLVNSDQIAAALINGYTPDVYALNYNFGTYQIEDILQGSTSFALYDHFTVENLIKNDPTLLPKPSIDIPRDKKWSKEHINGAITQGILQGESIPKIAKRLQDTTDMNRRAAIRNARTATTGAQNAGRVGSYQRAKDMGIDLEHKWLATLDGRTRHEHRLLDGQTVALDDSFEVEGKKIRFPGDPQAHPSLVYNCFVGDTSAYTNCDVIRSYAHQYDGDLIEIKTASGVNFTCTPNHPILTLNGWVSAASLHNGDDLLVTRIGNKFNFGRYCNIQHIFSSMKTFHDSLKRNGTIERDAALRINFHGDIPTSEVEIVTQKRFLPNDGYPGICESVKKFLLKFSNKTLFCKRTFMEHFRSVWFSAFGDIRRRSKLLSFFKRHLGHSEVHRLRPIALFDAHGVKPLQNDISGNIERIRDCLDGFSGIVFADNIVNVNISSGCTHVYNLQTENGYYFVNSIISQKNKKYNDIVAISHNCRCTLVPVIKGFERDDSWKYDVIDYDNWKKGGYEFEDWLEDQAEPDSAIMGVWSGNKMSQIYNLIKAQNTTDANKFYNELKKLGKPSDVWEQYLTGQLDAEDLEKFEGILKKYLPKPADTLDDHEQFLLNLKKKDFSSLPNEAYTEMMKDAINPSHAIYGNINDYWDDYLAGKIKNDKLDDIFGWKGVVKTSDKIDNAAGVMAKEAQDSLDKLKIKAGNPMTKDDADTYKVNPLYNKSDKTTTTNCQTSSFAYECRRQGYDVVALPKDDTLGDIFDLQKQLGQNQAGGWINKQTGKPPAAIIKQDNPNVWAKKSDMLDELEQKVGHNGERYTLSVRWTTGGAHVVNLDRDENGILRVIDNQRGPLEKNTWTIKEYFDEKSIANICAVYRVDDCVPNADFFNKIVVDSSKMKSTLPVNVSSLASDKYIQVSKAAKASGEAPAIHYKKWKYGIIDDPDLDDVFNANKAVKTATKVNGDVLDTFKSKDINMSWSKLSHEEEDIYDDIFDLVHAKAPKSGKTYAEYWSEYINGKINDEDIDDILSGYANMKYPNGVPKPTSVPKPAPAPIPKPTSTPVSATTNAVDIDALKTKKVTQVYNEIKDDMSTKDANAFYNELKKVGAKDGLKQGDVWKKYLAGELDADDVVKIEKHLGKYKTATAIPTPKSVASTTSISTFDKVTALSKYNSWTDIIDNLYDVNENLYLDIKHEVFSLKDNDHPTATIVLQAYKKGEIVSKELDDLFEKMIKELNPVATTTASTAAKAVTQTADVFDISVVKGKKMSAVYNEIKAEDSKAASQFYNGLKKIGKPSDVWESYLKGELTDAQNDFIGNALKKHYAKGGVTQTTQTVAKTVVTKSDDLIKAEEKLKKAEEELAKLPNPTYSGIWKDNVTLADYESKKGTIAGKKQYYIEEIEKLDNAANDPDSWLYKKYGGSDGIDKKIIEFEKHINDLDDFEKAGKEYAKAQKAVNDAKQEVLKNTPVGEAFTQERKDNAVWVKTKGEGTEYKKADKYYDETAKKVHGAKTSQEHEGYYHYTWGSGPFNQPLAGFDGSWSSSDFKGVGKVNIDKNGYGDKIRGLTSLCEKSTYDRDFWCQTGQDEITIESFLGIKPGTLSKMTEAEAQQFVGVQAEIPQFISTAINKGGGSYNPGNMTINIYVPAGSEALYVREDGHFGKAEHEMILQRGATYKIAKIYKASGIHGHTEWIVDLEVHPEFGYDKFQQTK